MVTNVNNGKEKKNRTIFTGLIIVIVVMVCLCIAGLLLIKPAEETVQGQAEATSVRVSGKLPGRVVAFYAEEGQKVKKGDTLVYIHSSSVDAKLYQAQAMESVAASQNRKAEAGARIQVINSAYELWQQALAAESIAKKTYERMDNLFKQGVVSEQKRDEAYALYTASAAQARAAKSQYDMAVEGAQSEDKDAARAMPVERCVWRWNRCLKINTCWLRAMAKYRTFYPHEGELVGTGTPINEHNARR